MLPKINMMFSRFLKILGSGIPSSTHTHTYIERERERNAHTHIKREREKKSERSVSKYT